MAKDKSNTVANTTESDGSFISEMVSTIRKSYSDIITDSNVKSISTHFKLYNKIIGGIPIGRMIMLQALEGVGKSSLMVQLAADVQKLGYPIIYLDTESAMSTQRFSQLGLDISNKQVIYLQPSSLQQVFNLIQDVIKTKVAKAGVESPAFIIWDSIAATPAEEELKMDEVTGVEVGIRARILSQGLRVITNLLARSNVSLLTVNQYRMKMATGPMQSWGGPSYTTPGGLAPRFNAYQIIELKDSTKFNDEEEDALGKLVKFKAIKNKMKSPLVEFSMYYTYDHGFDDPLSMFYYLKENKFLISAGPRWHLQNLTDVNFYKKEFADVYNTDSKFIAAVDEILNSGDAVNEVHQV
jgi:RecA/RadA recombinase